MGLTVPFVLAGRPEALRSQPFLVCLCDVLRWFGRAKSVVRDRPSIWPTSDERTVLRDRMLQAKRAE